MTIKQLTYLLEIEKQGSFNKASKSLFVTQPNITKVIKSLEEDLGVSLVFRNTKSKCVIFTPEGKELLEYAKSLVEHFKLVEDSFKSNKNRFCVSSQYYSFVMEAFIKEILEDKEDSYEYVISEGKLQNVVDDIVTMKSCIGFICLYDDKNSLAKKSLEEKGIAFTSLKKVKPHIFIRKNHPLEKLDSITLEDLKDYPAVFFDQEITALNFGDNTIKNIVYKKLIKVTDRDTIYSIIKNTNAYNIGSGAVNSEVCDEIVCKKLQGDVSLMDIGYINLKTSIVCSKMSSFIDKVSNILNNLKS